MPYQVAQIEVERNRRAVARRWRGRDGRSYYCAAGNRWCASCHPDEDAIRQGAYSPLCRLEREHSCLEELKRRWTRKSA